MPDLDPIPGRTANRFIGGVFGFAFAGIGLTVLGFLWGAPFGSWDSPPLFFRIFGSFIAIVFVAVGGTVAVGAIRGTITSTSQPRGPRPWSAPPDAPAAADLQAGGYRCPHCGAPLPARADVSPLGDVKCPFCNAWFNIHQPTA